MGKFANQSFATPNALRVVGPTNTVAPTSTYEGGDGYTLDARTELFTLATTDFGGEDTFYQSGNDRLDRLARLVATLVRGGDTDWLAGFARWLRDGANMRSAAVAVACEYVAAGGPNGRAVIDSVCVRADEPAEVLGYWLARKARNIPKPVKRGVADAAARLYTPRNLAKYDGGRSPLRFGDVIELTHAKPVKSGQSTLFRHAIDRRHGRPTQLRPGELFDETLESLYGLETLPPEVRVANLAAATAHPLMTWERLAGWLPGGMNAAAWEALIDADRLGYMALLRNLNNFDRAGISKAHIAKVNARLADPIEVAASRQLPFRFYTAYRTVGSLTYASALEQAMEYATSNVPTLSGRTLVAVDTSGSMQSTPSGKSTVLMSEIAAVFAGALAQRSDVDLIHFATGSERITPARSVLRTVELIRSRIGSVGGGTNTWPAIERHFTPGRHDRVIVLTDMQSRPSTAPVPAEVPVYVWDLRGYGSSDIDLGRGRFLLAGFSDKAFSLIGTLERGRNADWPWIVAA
jgi:hypothetical protein